MISATRGWAITRVIASPQLLAAVLIAGAFPGQVMAGEQSGLDAVKQALQARLPDMQIEQVLPSTVIPGFYDVVTTGEVIYVDPTLRKVIVGRVYQSDSGDNLTAQRWDSLHPAAFELLPLERAIKIVHGKGTRRIAVFSDPLCPYCRELEQTLRGVDDLTVYVFPLPLEAAHPGAEARAREIWCAPDQSEAWNAWMLESRRPAVSAPCPIDPIPAMAEMAARLKVSSTPTTFFADGHRVTGAMGADVLAAELRKTLIAGPVIAQ